MRLPQRRHVQVEALQGPSEEQASVSALGRLRRHAELPDLSAQVGSSRVASAAQIGGVLSMSADPPGCATAGTTTAEVMRFAGRTLRNNGKIVRVGPGCELTWRTTAGVDAEGVRAVEPRGPDRCQVRLSTRVRPHGFGRALAPVAHLLLQRRITSDAQRLRALAEARPPVREHRLCPGT
jgi:hypothetical protein